jgi:hypothetical protein
MDSCTSAMKLSELGAFLLSFDQWTQKLASQIGESAASLPK